MRAVVVSQPGSASVETVKDPAPLDDEVIVKVLGCGICGTDLHLLHDGLPNLPYPVIPGHEPWGEIVGLARGKQNFGWVIGLLSTRPFTVGPASAANEDAEISANIGAQLVAQEAEHGLNL